MSTNPWTERVDEAWIDALVTASLGGPAPATLAALIDPKLCAEMAGLTKLGAAFRFDGAEAPELWVASRGEVDGLPGKVAATWPDSAPFLKSVAALDQVYCTDGGALRVFAIERGDVAGPRGFPVLAHEWRDGKRGVITRHDAVPTAVLPAQLAERALAFAGKVRGGLWGVRWLDGEVVGISWTSEGVSLGSLPSLFRGIASGPRFAAALAVYEGAGLGVQPWFIEFDGTGGGRVCLWGVHAGLDASALPAIFASGATPDAEAFAAEVAALVAPEDADAVTARVRDELYPAVLQLRDPALDEARHVAAFWTWLVVLAGQQLPPARRVVIDGVTDAVCFSVLYRDAYHLAVARYLASHPDAQPPADLPTALVGLKPAEVVARATALQPTAEALEAAVRANTAYDFHRYGGSFEVAAPGDMLSRAVSGEFQGATAVLHDYLTSLGRLGYDDDPTQVLEMVELEPDAVAAQDAVLDAALAPKVDE